MGIYLSTVSGGGAEYDRRMQYLASLEQFYSAPIGIKISGSLSDSKVSLVDINKNILTGYNINQNPIFAGIRECCINPTTGAILYEDYSLDGSDGNIMVEHPTFKYKYELDGTDQYIYIIPQFASLPGFSIFPSAVMNGGTIRPKIWFGANEAHGYLDPTDSKFKLGSASGKQPVTGGVYYPDLPNGGQLTIGNAISYANNIGAGYDIMDVWSHRHLLLLMLFDTLNRNSQTVLGHGVSNLDNDPNADGGFAGKLTGADSIDSNLDWHGTGVGTGNDGYTPTSWRYARNLYGNVSEFLAGINLYSENYTYSLLKRDGSAALAGAMPAESREIGVGVVPSSSNVFISKTQTDELGATAFIPLETTGTLSTWYCDTYSKPTSAISIVATGGNWYGGSANGINAFRADIGISTSARSFGCRLVYHP